MMRIGVDIRKQFGKVDIVLPYIPAKEFKLG
jgi:hypothetical protein